MAKTPTVRSPERAPDDEDEDQAALEADALDAEARKRPAEKKPEEPERPDPERAQRDDDPDDAEVQEDPDEKEARRFGWKPQSEWKGAKPWQNAKEFLDVTFANRALFENRFETYKSDQDRVNKELLQKVQDASDIIGELHRDQKKIRKQGYDQARAEIERDREAAIASGNVEEVKALEAQRAEVDKIEAEEAKPAAREERRPPEKEAEPEVPREVKDWVAANPWFASDETLGDLARVEHRRLLREEKGLSLTENLDRVAQKVMETYPDKFGQQRQTASRVAAPRSRGADGRANDRKARSYENLPAEAKRTADKWAKQGIMPREQYVKDYEWDT